MTLFTDLTSLAEVAALADGLPTPDLEAIAAAEARQMSLTKPPRALGRLEDLAVFMAGWQGTDRPEISKAQALVFAGNHGICARGVNPFPQEVTVQMVANFEAGGAAINQMCRASGAELAVVALDLDQPTGDFTARAAMTEAEVLSAMTRGAAAVPHDAQVLILGEMGIGNSTVAAALAAGAFGGASQDWVGRGTGSDEAGRALKALVLDEGRALHATAQGLDLLVAYGGREQSAICGAVLQARALGIPVLLDGYICTAAVAPLYTADPRFLAHCLVGHASAEPGHARLMQHMGQSPILSLDMALGEGTGAALALGVLRAALACHNGMATFAEAQVSGG